jgi:hypothetical protein
MRNEADTICLAFPTFGAESAGAVAPDRAPLFVDGEPFMFASMLAVAPEVAEIKKEIYWSGRRDLNPGPLAPQASALARLRHGPNTSV